MYEHDYVIIDDEDEVINCSSIWGVFDKAVQQARAQIMAQEDAEIFRILDSIAASDIKFEYGDKDS